jgi:hypothetical protein
MRQWLEAGYFKGDLPISQIASGPFHPLSVWFPDLNFAFMRQPINGNHRNQTIVEERSKVDAAEKDRWRREAETADQERRAAEEAQRAAQEALQRELVEREAAAREAERQTYALKGDANTDSDVNESSNQLKIMLGLSSGAHTATGVGSDKSAISKKVNEKKAKTGNKSAPQQYADEISRPVASPQPAVPASASAAPAWGGASNNKQSRKSMSEIQQEEARAAAILAAKRGSIHQPSSGWANVAAGSAGWSAQNPAPIAGVHLSQIYPMPQASVAQGGGSRKVAPITQQQRSTSMASSTAGDEFGATIPPSLEKWSKEKILQLTGQDDLTLIAFCMTLKDANEIRQYFNQVLGDKPQVNSFANDFIQKRGLGSEQECWETPGSAKKGRKKKAGR